MIKKISKFIKRYRDEKEHAYRNNERKILEKKVEQGTDFAVKQYRKVFEKLAEYDRK